MTRIEMGEAMWFICCMKKAEAVTIKLEKKRGQIIKREREALDNEEWDKVALLADQAGEIIDKIVAINLKWIKECQ